MGIYPKVIVLRCTWYWYLVLGIVLKWGFHPSKVVVLTQFASARHRALGNGHRLLSFSRFIIRSNVNSEIFGLDGMATENKVNPELAQQHIRIS